MAKNKKTKPKSTKHLHPGKSLGFWRDQARANKRNRQAAKEIADGIRKAKGAHGGQ
jgi:hypothetical protein